jgi:alpha-glucosidase
MNNKHRIFPFTLVAMAFGLFPWGSNYAATVAATSPDQAIRFTLSDDQNQVRYSLIYRNQQVIDPSRLGMTFKQAPPFADGFIITAHETSQHDQSWQQPWGEAKIIRDQHQELLVTLADKSEPKRRYRLRVRIFNDGVGFRYEVPIQNSQADLQVTDELTEFVVKDFAEAEAWWIPARGWNRYEYLYQKTDLAQLDRVHTPLTLRLKNQVHISIHEAALVNYPAMTIDQRRPGVLKADLIPWSDGVKAKLGNAFVTPWRTIQISDKATGLLNSHLILNLNEPSKLGDVSWVKPGKYIGIWWGMHLGIQSWGEGENHGATTENAKAHLDFAAANGFDGVLIEGWNQGWNGDWFKNGDLFSFTRAFADFDLALVAAYDLYQQHGVTQIKTGYVADGGNIKRVDEQDNLSFEWHDGQFMVNEYLHSVTEAAKRQISINTHEPVKDTGLRRTYPNWISREGARGQEFNAWGSPPNSPEHTVNLVYTRMLAGPMDFTPGIFNLAYQGLDAVNRVPTTLAKQLALYVVLYSPIQMAADLPEHYRANPAPFQFIRDVATDWQQSIALAGEVGDYVVFARQVRDAQDWFIGAITDEQARDITINLDFLAPDTTYRAQIYRDDEKADWQTNPYAIVIEEKKVTAKTVLAIRLATSGGVAIRLQPL